MVCHGLPSISSKKWCKYTPHWPQHTLARNPTLAPLVYRVLQLCLEDSGKYHPTFIFYYFISWTLYLRHTGLFVSFQTSLSLSFKLVSTYLLSTVVGIVLGGGSVMDLPLWGLEGKTGVHYKSAESCEVRQSTPGGWTTGKQSGVGVRKGIHEEITFSYKANKLWRPRVGHGDYSWLYTRNLLRD